MILRRYIVRDICYEDDFRRALKELPSASQAVMKFGYPKGEDAEEYLIIYALYSNEVYTLMQKHPEL